MFSDRRLDDLATMMHHPRVRALLIVGHVFAVADDVAAEDCL
jgi:hypothetical protein